MIDLRRSAQLGFGEGFIAEETATLWEPWMRHADQLLEGAPMKPRHGLKQNRMPPRSKLNETGSPPPSRRKRMRLRPHVRSDWLWSGRSNAKARAEQDAKAEEEQRRVRTACGTVYQNTADKKTKDLTVREEQQ